MRTLLARLAAGGAALVAGAAMLLLGPAPARADTVFIEVNPSTILAGNQVTLRASCGANVDSARATSLAFGTVTLTGENGFLIGTATIPIDKRPSTYIVRLTCASGSTATTKLWVISASSTPTRGPNTGGGYLAHRGGGGIALLAGGLAAVAAGGALAVWTVRRRRAAMP
jgi:hypothetical protein